MRYLEGLYIPRPGVERTKANVQVTEVARTIIAGFKYKGHLADADTVDEAVRLARANDPNIPALLLDPSIVWHRESWPVAYIRMSSMHSSEDPRGMAELEQGCNKSFERFASKLKMHPEAIESDPGFSPQPGRDELPLIGLRGKLHNHILDGHHRIVLAVWSLTPKVDCLTAYKKPLFARR